MREHDSQGRMEDEWEAFIVEAREKGYGEDSEDEPIMIIPSSKILKSTNVTENLEEPMDAEEAVRQAGLGMSGLSISSVFEKKPRISGSSSTENLVKCPPMTPLLYSKLKCRRDQIIYNELAVIRGIGVYPKKSSPLTIDNISSVPIPSIPNTLFLNPGTSQFQHGMSSIESIDSADPSVHSLASHVHLSASHLFSLICITASMHSTPLVIQLSIESDGNIVFGALDLPFYGDLSAALISLHLPVAMDLVDAKSMKSTLRLNNHLGVTVYGWAPIVCMLPGKFSESLAAICASFSQSQEILVGRLDPFASSLYNISKVTVDIQKSLAVASLSHILTEISTLPIGDYTLIHRSMSDVIAVCRERETESECLFPFSPLLDHDSMIPLVELNGLLN